MDLPPSPTLSPPSPTPSPLPDAIIPKNTPLSPTDYGIISVHIIKDNAFLNVQCCKMPIAVVDEYGVGVMVTTPVTHHSDIWYAVTCGGDPVTSLTMKHGNFITAVVEGVHYHNANSYYEYVGMKLHFTCGVDDKVTIVDNDAETDVEDGTAEYVTYKGILTLTFTECDAPTVQ